MTVAMKLACHEIIPPKEWHHSSTLTDNHNDTVAIILAEYGIIPPKEWYHDPEF